MKNSEILRKISEILKTYGWIQGRLGNKEEGFCIVGAKDHIGTSDLPKSDELLGTLLGLHLEYDRGVAIYNDSPGRTKKQVLDKLSRRARYYEAMGQ